MKLNDTSRKAFGYKCMIKSKGLITTVPFGTILRMSELVGILESILAKGSER
jgi:hypothetical protein